VKLAFICLVAGLSGCQALTTAGDVLSVIAPTPQEQCQQSGGQWRVVTAYDAQGNPQQHEECISQ